MHMSPDLELDTLLKQALFDIEEAKTLDVLEQIRVHYFGKKGRVTEKLKALATLSIDKRPQQGQALHRVKEAIFLALQNRKQVLETQALADVLAQEKLDVTLPGRNTTLGSIHPVSRVATRIETFFTEMGFEILEGPEIETDHYNFEALNMPSHHPARAMHDTFYVSENLLLRTHTSPVQIRAMETRTPPVRLIAPGRVYRCDSDPTHTPMFHQVEGLFIDENASFANLKGIVQAFFEFFFERALSVRFRPSYFPFTEPSAEVDIMCVHCNGSGCKICKDTGWLEVMGCGMVHPKVLEVMHIDSERYLGWAFGLGIDRMAMLRYGIDDLRILFENDLKFLRQF